MFPLNHPLFLNITQEEYDIMLSCGGIRTMEYDKNSILFHTGDFTEEFGILISGEIYIESIDLWGNRMILHQIAAGDVFAETYALCHVPMMVDVTAVQYSMVLFVNLKVLLSLYHQKESWYMKLMQNLLLLSIHKNLLWSGRMLCISSKSIRSRVMTYLSSEAMKCGKMEFSIPFDRQQMADYLNVERSALSKELGRMQKEGILTFSKNNFKLYTLEK